MSAEGTQRLVHELQVHQIELEMQNEELRRAQLELAQSRDRFADLYDFAPVGYLTLDADAVIRQANLTASALLGTERQRLVGKAFTRFVARDSQDVFYRHQRTVLGSDQKQTCELRLRRADGSTYPAQLEATRSEDPATRLRECRCVISDITPRKQAEAAMRQLNETLEQRVAERTQALHKSQTDLNHAQAVAHIGSWRSDLRSQALEWSEETCRIFGIPPGTPMTYGKLLSRIHPEDREFVNRAWQAAHGGTPYDLEHRILVDGTVKWVRVKAELEFDPQAVLLGGFGTLQDITERKRAEAALHEAHEFNKQIIASAREGIVVLDREGRLLVWNSFMEEISGFPAAEVLCTHPVPRFPFLRNYDFDRMLQRTLAGGNIDSPDMFFDGGGKGRRGWFAAHFSPLRDADGAITRVIVVVNDVTERKELERHLLEISEREQVRIGQDLHDGLSQQFTGIRFMNATLQKRLADQAHPGADEARRIGELLTQAQDGLRQVARGLQPVVPTPDGLMNALYELAESIASRCRVTCRFECPRPVLIRDNTIATHLFRITQEAVNNALRHGHPRSVTVSLTETKGTLALQVQDDGQGWRPAQPTPAGLGLRIMKSRSEAMSGQVEIGPARPRGTVVRCIVPLAAPQNRNARP